MKHSAMINLSGGKMWFSIGLMLLLPLVSAAQEMLEPTGRIYNFLNNPSSLALNGDYLYVGSWDGGMHVLDISDLSNPFIANYFDEVTGAVRIVDSLLFLSAEHRIKIYRFSDPINPIYLADLAISGESCFGFACDDNLVLVLSYTEGPYDPYFPYITYYFELYDLSDPRNPNLVYRETEASGAPFSPWGCSPNISHNYLYMYYEWDGDIAIYDLSDPAHPEELEHFNVFAYPLGFNNAGSILYAAEWLSYSQERLLTIDIADPANPEIISATDTLTGRYCISDTLIFVNTRDNEITVYNAANPDTFTVWSVFNTQAPIGRGFIGQRQSFAVFDSSNYFEFFDLSDPEAVELSSTFENWGMLYDVDCQGDVAFIAAGSDGVRIVDITNPENPEEIGNWHDGRNIIHLAVDDNLLIAAEADTVMYILDITDPTAPQELSRLAVRDRIQYIEAADGYAFLLIRDAGIHIYDFTNPAEPVRVSIIDGSLTLRVYGDYLYKSSGGTILRYDISDRSRPQLDQEISIVEDGWISSFYIEDGWISSFYEDGIIYLINRWVEDPGPDYSGYEYFIVADISDPESVQLLYKNETRVDPHYFHCILATVVNRQVFISMWSRLYSFSTWDRRRPTVSANFNGVNRFQSLAVSGNLALVSDYNELLIYDCSELLSAPHADPNPLPVDFSLEAYPNPFNSFTTITYALPASSNVALQIFNIRGQLVDVLLDRIMPAGRHDVVWDASRVNAGLYFIRLTSSDRALFRKAVVVK